MSAVDCEEPVRASAAQRQPDSAGAGAAVAAATAAPMASGGPADVPIDKIVVAIHGIGSQRRSDTIRSVARRFGDRSCPPLPLMPLGFFHLGKAGEVQVSRLDAPDGDPLQRIGFAEVFWADIPRKVVKDEDTLEETKAWGASVVSRAHATYRRKVTDQPQLDAEDFQLGAGVINEIVETVSVLENLLVVTEKMGVFKFELGPLLRDYIGDVQIVTEFSFYRQKIVARFHGAMAQIVERFGARFPGKEPELYIVAHSEGTVVSLLGLLEALAGKDVFDPEAAATKIRTDWIRHVRGFMTIGSPIDKHIVLWPAIWSGLDLASRRDGAAVVFEHGGGGEGSGERLRLKRPIQWRNYYDFGDPIGFKLESAVRFLADQHCHAFEFDTDRHDFGFSRYWLPGKAHNDYWGDPQVFGHFIDDVVMRPPPPGSAAPSVQPTKPVQQVQPVKPESRRFVGIFSTAIPYLLALALHLGAVFVLFKAVTIFLASNDEAGGAVGLMDTLRQVGLLGLLLFGVTVAARLPRLVKTTGLRWHVAAVLAFLAAALPSWIWLPKGLAAFLGQPFLTLAEATSVPAASASVAGVLLGAALAAASGWIVPRRPRIARRTLMACGAFVVLLMLIGGLVNADAGAQGWPVALGGAAFLYLWWLGILLFDLAFVWHRYIRQSVAIDTLAAWQCERDASPVLPGRPGKPASGSHAPTLKT